MTVLQGYEIIEALLFIIPDVIYREKGYPEQPDDTPGCGHVGCTRAARHHEDMGAAEAPFSCPSG